MLQMLILVQLERLVFVLQRLVQGQLIWLQVFQRRMDSIPMIVITGQVGRAFIGTDAFQEVDIYNVTKPIVKASYVIYDVSSIQFF